MAEIYHGFKDRTGSRLLLELYVPVAGLEAESRAQVQDPAAADPGRTGPAAAHPAAPRGVDGPAGSTTPRAERSRCCGTPPRRRPSNVVASPGTSTTAWCRTSPASATRCRPSAVAPGRAGDRRRAPEAGSGHRDRQGRRHRAALGDHGHLSARPERGRAGAREPAALQRGALCGHRGRRAHRLDRQRQPLPIDTAVLGYRVLRETLRNVVRHSGAARAGRVAADRGSDLVIVVEDDGVGFDPTRRPPRGTSVSGCSRTPSTTSGAASPWTSPPNGGTRVDGPLPHQVGVPS